MEHSSPFSCSVRSALFKQDKNLFSISIFQFSKLLNLFWTYKPIILMIQTVRGLSETEPALSQHRARWERGPLTPEEARPLREIPHSAFEILRDIGSIRAGEPCGPDRREREFRKKKGEIAAGLRTRRWTGNAWPTGT